MELLFEARLEISEVIGKVYFFQARPTLYPQPVLVGDTACDGAGVTFTVTVLRDGGRFRMWYHGWPKDWNGLSIFGMGYAESDDGLTWRKPALGLIDEGDGPNNLTDLGLGAFSIFIDPDAPASHRYRATGHGVHGPKRVHPKVTTIGYYTAHSADGLHWELDQGEPRWPGADVNTCVWHPQQNRAIIALKQCPRMNKFGRRAIWNAELKDGQWSEQHCALVPDEFDDVCAIREGFSTGDYYGMGMMPAGSGTVGFIWQFRHSLPRLLPWNSGVFGATDVTLAYQAGRHDRWLHLPGRKNFIAHEDVPWGAECVCTASGAVTVGDEQWLYFSGTPYTHGWYVTDEYKFDEKRIRQIVEKGVGRIGFATWPRDRLFGLRSDPQGVVPLKLGEITEPSELILNYKTQTDGHIRVEFVDVDGYSLDDAAELTGDDLSGVVAWKKGSTIGPLAADKAVARLHLESAEVYAYELVPKR